MSRKLNQVLAVEKGIKTKTYAQITELHKTTQKHDLTDGFFKNYQPLKEDGAKYPSESKKVQLSYDDVFKQVNTSLVDLFDVTAAKDYANCTAFSDVVVDGVILVEKAPATYLLFLKKQLTDLDAFVSKFVELKPDVNWSVDPSTGLNKSDVVTTHKTEKLQEGLLLAPSTEFHPAQTQLVVRDVLVGHWNTTHFSGALPKPRKTVLLERIQKTLRAVKEALESANSVQAPDKTIGANFLNYLFA